MTRSELFIALSLSAAFLTAGTDAAPPPSAHFSPAGGCTDAVVREVGAARSRVRVLAYSFTSPPVAGVLAEASKRGVDVRVVLDAGQDGVRSSRGAWLVAAGVPVLYDHAHAIAHNKTMVIDDYVVITGSFNFTESAEHRNAENLLVVRDAGLAAAYLADWGKHCAHSVPPKGPR